MPWSTLEKKQGISDTEATLGEVQTKEGAAKKMGAITINVSKLALRRSVNCLAEKTTPLRGAGYAKLARQFQFEAKLK